MKRKILFIDRDGTLILEPEDKQIDRFDKLQFYPGAISALAEIASKLDYELVMVSNQDGLGTDSFPEEDFQPVHDLIMRTLEGEGIRFREVLIDRSTEAEPGPGRKPALGMMAGYLQGDMDRENSFVIGDRSSDVAFAAKLGIAAIRLSEAEDPDAVFCSSSWAELKAFLFGWPRRTEVRRKTGETEIHIVYTPDGSGRADIETGIGFFDHMLEQIARHSGGDLMIRCRGDLHVDEHHSVEDTGLALGEAVSKALGDRRGIERYAFVLPMDESLARVALDFSGRPWLVWDAEFRREKIGDMPTELFAHFFKSFSDRAGCTLNIGVEGENEHHKIEGIFKAFAKCLGQAARRTGSGQVPSTKGML